MITLILIAVVVILITSLVYASTASTKLPDDDDLKTAKSRLVWVSVVGWLAVSIMAILAIVFLFEDAEILISGGSAIMYIVLLAILGLLGFVAWLTISATQLVGASSEFAATTDKTADINVAYGDAYLAAALSLGTILTLVVILFSYYAGRWSVGSRRRPRHEEMHREEFLQERRPEHHYAAAAV